jgi:hypothetical protein
MLKKLSPQKNSPFCRAVCKWTKISTKYRKTDGSGSILILLPRIWTNIFWFSDLGIITTQQRLLIGMSRKNNNWKKKTHVELNKCFALHRINQHSVDYLYSSYLFSHFSLSPFCFIKAFGTVIFIKMHGKIWTNLLVPVWLA